MIPAYTPAEREFALADRAEKTSAIKRAREAMIKMEELLESTINLEPRRFEPSQAAYLRNQFRLLGDAIDSTVNLLTEERDEFADLNGRLAWLNKRVDDLTKGRDSAQERAARLYNEKMTAERELHQLRMKEAENVADCD